MTDAAPQPQPREALRAAKRAHHRAWLQLVRAPNLLTALGDPIAGACLAGGLGGSGSVQRVLLASAAAVSVYAAGLVDNDLVDYAEDGGERPNRPLPSGAVSRKEARRGRVLLFSLPYLIACAHRMPAAWVVVHVLLLVACLGYNRLKGRSAVLGAWLMGLCRALSLFSGVVLGWELRGIALWPLAAALPWLGYVAGIALFAARETTQVPGWRRYLLGLAPLAMGLAAWLPGIPREASWGMAAAGLCGVVLVLDVMVPLRGAASPAAVPPAVGRVVRALVPMQALLCLSLPRYGVACAGALLLCWVFSERVGRRFYAS